MGRGAATSLVSSVKYLIFGRVVPVVRGRLATCQKNGRYGNSELSDTGRLQDDMMEPLRVFVLFFVAFLLMKPLQRSFK